jgi:uncharacterized membrane protein
MGFCCNGFGWGGWGAWGGLGIVGLLLSLVLFVGVLAVLGLGTAWLVRQLGRRSGVLGGVEVEPLEIARRRLAAGEITSAEFEEIRGRLQS